MGIAHWQAVTDVYSGFEGWKNVLVLVEDLRLPSRTVASDQDRGRRVAAVEGRLAGLRLTASSAADTGADAPNRFRWCSGRGR